MKITFFGTRGSIPVPGKTTVEFGGNTPCLSLELESGHLIILDAGTGIRKLGLSLAAQKKPLQAYIFITHSHWDHIQGIPFFVPIYGKENKFTIISNTPTTKMLKQSLKDLLKHPYFPVDYNSLPSKITFELPKNNSFTIGKTAIETISTRHPDTTSAFKFTENGKTFVYMTDNEIGFPEQDKVFFNSIASFCENSDLLVHDTMYTKEEYPSKIGWGHSCFDSAIELSLMAHVKKLAFFHYEPEHSDEKIRSIEANCKDMLRSKKSPLELFAAREGDTVIL